MGNMTPERYEQIGNLYHAALEREPATRADFLAAACGVDEAMRREVASLITAHEQAGNFIERPPDDVAAGWQAAAGTLPSRSFGRYRILSPLGKGGMGEVWLAEDTQLGRKVAVKLLPSEFAHDAERLRRFAQEARATSALNHPNILTVHDIGNHEGAPYIVVELLEGAELRASLKAGALPVRTALEYARQIAAGLAAAHERGIVHRDLKPENLFVTSDRRVKILDFGLAKLKPQKFAGDVATQNPQRQLTDAGVIMGTVGYMSPEQVRGEEVDQRSDLFSFGSIFYEMLAGQRAFHHKSMAETMASILKEEPPKLAELSETNNQISPQLGKIVRHCLEKKPEMRFQSARDLGFALEALTASPGVPPELPPVSKSVPQLGRAAVLPVVKGNVDKTRLFGNTRLAWMVTVLVVLTALALTVAWFLRAPAESGVTYTYLPLPEKTTSLDISGAALSPDGRRVVMMAVTEGYNRLWLYSFDRAVPELLPGTEEAQAPFWSPNGQSIGFFAQSKLKRIEVSGGMPTTLCEAPLGAGGAWSSTGVILFASQFNGAGLSQVSESGGTSIPVTSLNAARFETGHNFPYFLPDGRHFIFFTQAGQPDYRGIRLGSLDSPQTSFLLRADTKAEYSAAGYLLLMRGRKILAQPFDPDKLVLSGDPVPVTEPVYYEAPIRYADLSVYGSRMLLYRRGGNQTSQLVWLDRGGKQLAAVVPAGDYRSMQLSAGGGQVLLDCNDTQVETSDIWQFDLLRETRTRLTSNPGTDTYPIWSPDGSQVAFASNREGFWGIYRVSGNGKEELLLKRDQHLLLTSDWSSDGNFIVYRRAHEKTGLDLELLPLFGDRQPRSYVATPFNESYGVVSPDGRWMAYQSNDSGRYEIYVQSFPEPGRKMPVSKGDGMLPRWRRDGKELYYVATNDKLMAVPVETGARFSAGAPVALFEVGSFGRRLNRYVYDVSADGKKFLVIRQLEDATTRPLTVVQNWTELLKR
jgi:eukaryotic-like serine/threonine-protein kinase